MARIIEEIEKSAYYRANIEVPDDRARGRRRTRSRTRRSTRRAGDEAQDDRRGLASRAARRGCVSEYRPEANIVCLTTNEVTFRRLALFWGVTPVLIGPSATHRGAGRSRRGDADRAQPRAPGRERADHDGRPGGLRPADQRPEDPPDPALIAHHRRRENLHVARTLERRAVGPRYDFRAVAQTPKPADAASASARSS